MIVRQAARRLAAVLAGAVRGVRVPACTLALTAATLGAAGPGLAASPATARSGSPATPADSALRVYLMTFGPGRQVWERFGHNAIWVHDPAAGTDQAYNYGLFDFHQQNFLLRFIRGQMWYWMAGFPAESYARLYRRDDRSIWVQELALSPTQRRELRLRLERNALPENRFYHYDYYRDNCSTRVRDALDQVLGGQIRAQTERVPSGTTYRFHTQRLTANDALVYTGLLAALGQGVDRPISAWEEMFLPISMREQIRKVRVRGPNGTAVPLVLSEQTVYASSVPDPPATPPAWGPAYLAIGVALGGLLLGLAAAGRESRAARVGYSVVGAAWALAAGLAGVVLAGLWGLTDHAMAYHNENLFQLNPLAILLGVSLAPIRRTARRFGRSSVIFAAVVAGVAALGLVLKVAPGFRQVNGPIIALALPAHLGLLAGAALLARRASDAWRPNSGG